jgi:hypothetical protein
MSTSTITTFSPPSPTLSSPSSSPTLKDNVKNNRFEIENIITNSTMFVREKQTVRFLSQKFAQEVGGDEKDWINQNRNLCGFFGSPDKIVPRYTKFRIPNPLIEKANQIYFNSLTSCRMTT